MAREGASVVVADINRSAAERVAGECATAVALEVDVSDNASNMLPVLYLQAKTRGFRVGLLGTVQYERAGGEAKGPPKPVRLLARQAVALNRQVALGPAHRLPASSSSRRCHSGQPSSSLRAERPADRS